LAVLGVGLVWCWCCVVCVVMVVAGFTVVGAVLVCDVFFFGLVMSAGC